MKGEQWGIGNAAQEKAFDTVKMGDKTLELIHGDHPHSRRDNSTYARTENGKIIGFDGHRRPFKIEIEEYNYLKSSGLSGDQIRKSCRVKIFCDGVQVFEKNHRTYEHAYRIAHQFILDMEMNWGWFPKEVDKEIGRIIGYREQVCRIQRFVISQGCMVIETLDGKPFQKFLWEDAEDFEPETQMKVEITSPQITWYIDKSIIESLKSDGKKV